MTKVVYICEACHETFESEKSDKEALAEMKKRHPGLTRDKAAVVCQGCFEQVMEWVAERKKRMN